MGSLFCVKSKASRLMWGRWYRESCWNGKIKQNMHGVGFPNATYWVCTQTGPNADLQWEPPFSCSAMHLIRPTGHFCQKQSATEGVRAPRRDAAYTDTSLHVGRGFLLHITISIHSLKFSLGMSTAARFVSVLSCPIVRHCRSLSSRYLYSKVNPSFFLWPHFS